MGLLRVYFDADDCTWEIESDFAILSVLMFFKKRYNVLCISRKKNAMRGSFLLSVRLNICPDFFFSKIRAGIELKLPFKSDVKIKLLSLMQ